MATSKEFAMATTALGQVINNEGVMQVLNSVYALTSQCSVHLAIDVRCPVNSYQQFANRLATPCTISHIKQSHHNLTVVYWNDGVHAGKTVLHYGKPIAIEFNHPCTSTTFLITFVHGHLNKQLSLAYYAVNNGVATVHENAGWLLTALGIPANYDLRGLRKYLGNASMFMFHY